MRQIPDKAIELVKRFEGFSSKPYLCPAGIPTIGYGSTFYRNGAKVKMSDTTIDKITATDMLLAEMNRCGAKVLKLSRVPLTDGQFGALASFVYNLGSGRLQASTLLRKLNRGDYDGAALEFRKWCFAGKKKLPGLVLRRNAEMQLFME